MPLKLKQCTFFAKRALKKNRTLLFNIFLSNLKLGLVLLLASSQAYVPHPNDFLDSKLRPVPQYTYLNSFDYHYEVLIESEIIADINKRESFKKFLNQAAIVRTTVNQGSSGISIKLLDNKLTETLMKTGVTLIKCIECQKLQVSLNENTGDLKIQSLGVLAKETLEIAKILGVKNWIDAQWEIHADGLSLNLKIIDSQKGNIVYAKAFNGRQIAHGRQSRYSENYEQIDLAKIQETLPSARVEIVLGSKFMPQLDGNRLLPSIGAQLGWRSESRKTTWMIKGSWAKQLGAEDLSTFAKSQKINLGLQNFFETLYEQYYEVGLGFAYQNIPNSYIFDSGSWEVSMDLLGFKISSINTFGADIGFTWHFGKLFSIYNSIMYIYPMAYKLNKSSVTFSGFGWTAGITLPLWI